MPAYYNEIDPFAAAWLRELIKAGHIAPGDVDERSITEVKASDLKGYTQCHFFAGIGVWSYALRQAGWEDSRPVWTGSCPCQSFSNAGKKSGLNDARHLWPIWFNLIRQCQPPVVFGEQVEAAIRHGWLDLVQADLEREDYAVGAIVFGAHSVGAPHGRQRLYYVAQVATGALADTQHNDGRSNQPLRQTEERIANWWSRAEWIPCKDGKSRCVEPGVSPLVNGAPARVGRFRGYGNAICAPAAQAFIEAYLNV